MKWMRKICMFILIMFLMSFFGQAFGYFEKKVYCNIEDQNVTIFLKKSEGFVRCQTYMDTLYQLAVKKYDEVLTIRSYISQGEDVYYWKKILEDKKSEFIQLINYRTQIKTAVDKFELALFDKYYDILYKPMKFYYSELEIQYYVLINQDLQSRTSDFSLKVAQLQQQMGNVKHILSAKTLDEIMEVAPSYLYLKDQLKGG